MKTEIRFDGANGPPPLMIVFPAKLRMETVEAMREQMRRAQEQGQIVVIEGPAEVYQLVGGEWRLLPGAGA